MATYSNVIQPNGTSLKLKAGSDEERLATAHELLSNWENYCQRNWISTNHADTFCGENKVKRFFSGLTYFLLLGNTEDMVTNYKEIMNGKREIPISSCPTQIEDLVYGTGSVLCPQTDEETLVFEITAEDVPNKKGRKAVNSEKGEKLKLIKKECGKDAVFTYCTVDTENCFRYNGAEYMIDSSVEAYAPKNTSLGLLYDIDKIICVKSQDGSIRFYTPKYDSIDMSLICQK